MSPVRKLPLIDLLDAWFGRQNAQVDRERLVAAIMCGDVLAAGERCREPRASFSAGIQISLDPDSPLAILLPGAGPAGLANAPGLPFVSRGGDKLEHVLKTWDVVVAARVWLDAGCSTGGFSHCLLRRGASLIHAVDVGYNVLDWRLRNLAAVAVHERCNIMGLTELDPKPEAAVADLSFRSMQGAAGRILGLVSGNELYALIKPQFERKYRKLAAAVDAAAKGPDEFKGVVASEEGRLIMEDVARRLAGDGISIRRIMVAGLRGRGGNQEYIAQLAVAETGATPELIQANCRQVAGLANPADSG